MAVINLTALFGKSVFTRNARLVGSIDDSMIETEKGGIYGFVVNLAKGSFLYQDLSRSEQGVKKNILIPFKEVIACDDIVLVTVPKKYEKEELGVTPEEEEVILPNLTE